MYRTYLGGDEGEIIGQAGSRRSGRSCGVWPSASARHLGPQRAHLRAAERSRPFLCVARATCQTRGVAGCFI